MKITKQIAYFNGEQWIDSEGDPLDDVNRKIGGYDGRKIIAICGSQLYRTLGYHDLLREVFGVGNLMVDNGEDNGEDDDEDDDDDSSLSPGTSACTPAAAASEAPAITPNSSAAAKCIPAVPAEPTARSLSPIAVS